MNTYNLCVYPGLTMTMLVAIPIKASKGLFGQFNCVFQEFNYLIPYAWANASAVSS